MPETNALMYCEQLLLIGKVSNFLLKSTSIIVTIALTFEHPVLIIYVVHIVSVFCEVTAVSVYSMKRFNEAVIRLFSSIGGAQ